MSEGQTNQEGSSNNDHYIDMQAEEKVCTKIRLHLMQYKKTFGVHMVQNTLCQP